MAIFHTQLLTIEGMQGNDAIYGVTHVLGLLPGIRIDSVEVGQARVLAEPSCEPLIREALAGAGFELTASEIES